MEKEVKGWQPSACPVGGCAPLCLRGLGSMITASEVTSSWGRQPLPILPPGALACLCRPPTPCSRFQSSCRLSALNSLFQNHSISSPPGDVFRNLASALQHKVHPTSHLSFSAYHQSASKSLKAQGAGQAWLRTELKLSRTFWKHGFHTRPLLILLKVSTWGNASCPTTSPSPGRQIQTSLG